MSYVFVVKLLFTNNIAARIMTKAMPAMLDIMVLTYGPERISCS